MRAPNPRPATWCCIPLAAALLAACSTGTPEATPPNPTPPRSATSIPAPTPTAPPTPSPTPAASSPTLTAQRWLAAYRTAAWTDTPTHWIDRVRPYVTDAMHTKNNTLRDGSVSADWTAFVNNQCASTVTDVGAVIPPESPGTSTTANVQVTGTVHTTCTAGTPKTPREPIAVTLILTRSADGTWRVDQQMF